METAAALSASRLVPAAPVGPVEQELQHALSSIERLHEQIAALESRVGVALADFPPTETNVFETRRHGSELANRLVDIDARITAAADRVGMLLSRLEL